MSKFYTIRQNNSGGYDIQNEDVDKFVCVEADNVDTAKSKFEKILAPYREYCPCCGERWNDDFLTEQDGYKVPTIYGGEYKDFKDEFYAKRNYSIIIYYLNGNIERHNLSQNLKRE